MIIVISLIVPVILAAAVSLSLSPAYLVVTATISPHCCYSAIAVFTIIITIPDLTTAIKVAHSSLVVITIPTRSCITIIEITASYYHHNITQYNLTLPVLSPSLTIIPK